VSTIEAICVYCGSNPGSDLEFSRSANALGRLLAERGITLVYGGGHVGLMGVIADATITAGGRVHGVITRALEQKEIAHRGLTRLDVTDSMHERKALMAEASDAFIMLPGGIGTLDEFFEAATWTQLGIHNKPCGILNVNGYFDPLIALLDRSNDLGFLRGEHRDLIVVAAQAPSLLDLLAAWEPVVVAKWLLRPDQ
jgi:uncharacterized protein (TIGR00730 family)